MAQTSPMIDGVGEMECNKAVHHDDDAKNNKGDYCKQDDVSESLPKKLSPSTTIEKDDDDNNLSTKVSHQQHHYLKTEAFDHLSDETKKELEDILTKTPMMNLTEDDIQIQYRNKLGEGSFCSVYPVYIKNYETEKINEDLPPFFAIKKLRLGVTRDEHLLEEAYDDLYREAIMMKDLQHESIITMFGMSDVSEEQTHKKNFFVVTEKLQSTLDGALKTWSNEGFLGYFKKITAENAVKERLETVALGIASGLKYLHSRNIVYRDIKPANIGFDTSGNVKIFDFGFAVHLPSADEGHGNSGKIQGKAGTLRYMAPEMKQGKLYDCSVDVYAYGVLLWQIVTTRIPFENELSTVSFVNCESDDKDVLAGLRPDLTYIENNSLSLLLEICWNEDPELRCGFDSIESELQRIIMSVESNDKSQSDNNKNNFFSVLTGLVSPKKQAEESNRCDEGEDSREETDQNRNEDTYPATDSSQKEDPSKIAMLRKSSSEQGEEYQTNTAICCRSSFMVSGASHWASFM